MVFSYPRGFAPRTHPHALSRAASSARSVRVARSQRSLAWGTFRFMRQLLEKGSSSPLGATASGRGVNFSVFSKHATVVELLLFDRVDDAGPSRIVRLDPSA